MKIQKNEKVGYKSRSIIFFVLSLISFCIYVYTLSKVRRGPWWYPDDYAQYAFMSLILSFTMFVISIIFYFKYKQNEKNIIYKNINIKTTLSAILLVLVFSWRLIVLILFRNLAYALQISITEWIIIVIGILLILLGIFKKSR